MTRTPEAAPRAPLSRDRVLRAAVTLADDIGIEALSMRRLAQELGVVPMALYKHVAHKEELLDGMVETVVGEIHPPAPGTDWRGAVRQRILSARAALLGHPWAARVIRSRTGPAPALLAHIDAVIGMFRAGGFSVDLTHHAMHALGSRVLGFTQEVFDDAPGPDPQRPATLPRRPRLPTRTSRSWPWPRPTTGTPSWATAVTTSSSSSSPSTSSWTASSASTSRAGRPPVAAAVRARRVSSGSSPFDVPG